MALVTDRSIEGQLLGLWQKHCSCKGVVTIVYCRAGWKIVFMSSQSNNNAQSRYSPIKGKCFTLYWAINKADYFLYGCDKLYVGSDHKPLLAYFRKVDPKPLDHIVTKRLRKYVSEIGELRFSIFHIPGRDNFLSDRGIMFPTGKADNDRGEDMSGANDPGSAKKVGAASAEIWANTTVSWPLQYHPEMHSQITLQLCRFLRMVHRPQHVTQMSKMRSSSILMIMLRSLC